MTTINDSDELGVLFGSIALVDTTLAMEYLTCVMRDGAPPDLPLPSAVFEHSDEYGNLFIGHQPRECGEHRTVGKHRAWCYDCSEWCYPTSPCVRCEIISLRARLEETQT